MSIDDPADDITGRWASRICADAHTTGDIPRYGSAAWHDLDDTDPRRHAAIVWAAECWRWYLSPQAVAEHVLAEVELVRNVQERAAEAARFADVARKVRHLASTPTYAELCDIRGEPKRAARARQDEVRLGLRAPDGDDAA